MEDASLSDFLEADAESEPTDSGGTDPAETAARDPPDGGDVPESAQPDTEPAADAGDGSQGEAAAVDPATVTATWRPGGDPCAECGQATEWRWRAADGQFVCRDCAAWDRV